MQKLIETGCDVVDEIGTWNITGNIIPHNWYRHITRENGKPYLLAVTILSEFVYWYRPTEVRDESTGQITGYRKRFRGDLLQKSYAQLAEEYGEGKSAVKRALDCLEETGVIERIWKTVSVGDDLVMNNVLFISLNPERLYQITFVKDEKTVLDGAPTPIDKFEGTLPTNLSTGSIQICRETPVKSVGTNTENTTEITNIDYSHHIYPEEQAKAIGMPDVMDAMEAYRAIIKENVEYDTLKTTVDFSKLNMLDEMVELIVETVSIPRDRIRIGGTDIPFELVKGKLSKLNKDHLLYVLECMYENKTEVRNIKAYLLTALYNAPNTMSNYNRQWINHDIHERFGY